MLCARRLWGCCTRTLASTTTELLYDGPNAVQEIQGGKATANLITGFLPDKVFARTTSKTTESLLTDALGSTIGLAGSTGSVESTYTYDPFGVTTKAGTASENATQYAGQEYDGNGLYYDRARYYSPTSAHFLNQDPTGQAGSGPNVYLYTNDSPTNATDPYGTHLQPPKPSPDEEEGGGGGGGGGGAGSRFGPGPSGSCGGGGNPKGKSLSSGGSWYPAARCMSFKTAEQQEEETRKLAEEGESGPSLCTAVSLGAAGMGVYYGTAGLAGSLAGPEVSGPLFLLSGTSEVVSGEFDISHDITGC